MKRAIGSPSFEIEQRSQSSRHAHELSLRAKDGMNVLVRRRRFVTVTWQEVEVTARRGASPLIFTSDRVLDRVQKLHDLFAPVLKLKQKLPMG